MVFSGTRLNTGRIVSCHERPLPGKIAGNGRSSEMKAAKIVAILVLVYVTGTAKLTP